MFNESRLNKSGKREGDGLKSNGIRQIRAAMALAVSIHTKLDLSAELISLLQNSVSDHRKGLKMLG